MTKQRILNVDDTDAGRYAVSRILRQAGFEVMEAANGTQALQLAAQRPDLILLDVNLPDMDGFEVCRRVRADPNTAAIPVVHLSATYVRTRDQVQGMEGGADGYLTHPVEPPVLVATIRAFLRLRTAEAELRESEDRYRDLVENSQDLICTHDLDGKLLSVNAAMERLTGHSRVALLRMNVADLLTRGALEAFPAYLAEIRAKGAASGMMHIRTAAGETRWWEYYNTLRRSGVAEPVVRGMGHDITERKRDAQALEQREAYLTAIIENQPGLVWLKDAKERFLAINTAFAASCGRKLEDVLDRTDFDIWPRDLAEKYAADDVKVMQTGQAAMVEELIHDKGQPKWFETFKAPVRDRQGRIIGTTGYARDITERKRADEALRESEERFRGLVEQSMTGIYIIQDGKFAYVNPRVLAIYRYASSEELIGRDALSTVAEKDRERVTQNMRGRIDGSVPAGSYEFTVRRKDGTQTEVGVYSSRATYQGRPAIIGMVQDISEKKRTEAQIQRYVAQLESAFMSTVKVATTLGEMRDPYTAGHQRRVAEIAVAIGAEMGLDARQQEGLRVAGYLHDIGKITIPAEILSKPGKLSPIEFKLIQSHPASGYEVLKDLEFPWPVAEVALQHHERIDGSGYPQGLKGEAIRLEARIMAVADVVEAMATHRPYRAALGVDAALAEIERGRGSTYDAAVADACIKLFRQKEYTIPA